MNQEMNSMYNDPEVESIVNRYYNMLQHGSIIFFDVHEYEILFEHFLQNGEPEKAYEIISLAISQYPASGELKLKKAQILIDQNKTEESLDLLVSIENDVDCISDFHLLKGIANNTLGNLNIARVSFAKAIELADEELADTYFSIALSYESVEDYTSAIPYLQKALDETGKNLNIFFELAYAYDKTDAPELSKKYYNEYLDMDPFSDIVWFNLGIVYSKQQNFKKAIEAFDYVIALNEQYTLAYFNKGNAHANLGDYQEAVNAYKQFLDSDPANIETLTFIGECFERMGELKQAMDYYQKALDINPDFADAIYGIGILQSICENFQESFQLIQRAIILNPENADYWYSLGNIQSKLNNQDEAIEAYERAIIIDPQDYESWLNLSEVYFKKNLLSKAIKILEDAYKVNGDIALINYRLAAYNLLKHNMDEGVKYFRRGIHSNFDEHEEVFKFYPEATQINEIQQIIKHYNPIQS